MKPRWEHNIIGVISATLILSAIGSLVTGCHTNKKLQVHSAEVATETAVGHKTDKTDMATFWEMFSRYVTSTDSVTMEMSADSIVTPSGAIIYAPDVKRTDYGQQSNVETEATINVSTNSETAVESTETSDKTTEIASAQQAETTVVAEPPDFTSIIIVAIIAVALIVMLIILWVAYRKK